MYCRGCGQLFPGDGYAHQPGCPVEDGTAEEKGLEPPYIIDNDGETRTSRAARRSARR